jgi:RimJ/RimL family protein N-acetyltransferase
MPVNPLGQDVGEALPDWQAPPSPVREAMQGRYCRLEPLSAQRHSADLWAASSVDAGASWTYLPYGPFESRAAYVDGLAIREREADPLFFAIVDLKQGHALGVCAYLRIEPAAGCIEVGHLYFSAAMRQTAMATEAMYLMMQNAFELGYRRYEWKCDALNAASRAAAERLGFQFEGVFRQARVIKGRNRDTAWFSIIDSEWPALRAAFERWLAPENFDTDGRQRVALSALTAK